MPELVPAPEDLPPEGEAPSQHLKSWAEDQAPQTTIPQEPIIGEDGEIIPAETIERVKPVMEILEDDGADDDDDDDDAEIDEVEDDAEDSDEDNDE